MVLIGPVAGVACSFAQAALVGLERGTGNGKAAERVASRWALAGALGDVAAPAILVVVGSRWRAAYFVGAAVTATLALLILGRRTSVLSGGASDGDDEEPAPRFTLRELLAARPVLLAALAATACTFLDEIVLGVGALYLGDRFALATSPRSVVLGAWTVAALAGTAAVSYAIERVSTPRLLMLSGGACGLAFASALSVRSPIAAGALLVVAAFFSSWHWPLCQALSLRAAGERPLLAGTASALWTPLELAAPFVVAAVAGLFGSPAAMALLLVQPVAVLLSGWAFARGRAGDSEQQR